MKPIESKQLEQMLTAGAVSTLPDEFRTRVLTEVSRALVRSSIRPESWMTYFLPTAAAALVVANLIWSLFLASASVPLDHPSPQQFATPFAATAALSPITSDVELRRLDALLRVHRQRPAHLPPMSTAILRTNRNEESVKWTLR